MTNCSLIRRSRTSYAISLPGRATGRDLSSTWAAAPRGYWASCSARASPAPVSICNPDSSRGPAASTRPSGWRSATCARPASTPRSTSSSASGTPWPTCTPKPTWPQRSPPQPRTAIPAPSLPSLPSPAAVALATPAKRSTPAWVRPSWTPLRSGTPPRRSSPRNAPGGSRTDGSSTTPCGAGSGGSTPLENTPVRPDSRSSVRPAEASRCARHFLVAQPWWLSRSDQLERGHSQASATVVRSPR